ncbi:Hypothetical protein SMAX5B_003419 [Scophthalmus maximus]|uniref:Uncharacterized protein n=1 Tax=Scophthalmus maximus TaxID=52904 RepID=A0A2U9CKL3_SCOMX|nr:Hypothetical protein SMAX5B_003419 [Scophthalmus maximus]
MSQSEASSPGTDHMRACWHPLARRLRLVRERARRGLRVDSPNERPTDRDSPEKTRQRAESDAQWHAGRKV